MAHAAQMICGADRAGRLRIDVMGTLRDSAWKPVDIKIGDISVTGVRMIAATTVRLGTLVSVGIAGLRIPAFVVRRQGQSYGCRFVDALPQEQIERFRSGTRQVVALNAPTEAVFYDRALPEDRFPIAQRMALLAGLGVLSWAAIIGVVVAFLQ